MKLFGSKKSKSKNKDKNKNKDQNQAASTSTPTKTEDAKDAFKGKEFVTTTPNASSSQQQEGSKRSKKKRFSLFKSSKSKKSSQRNSADENVVTTTTTPSTVRTDFDDQQQQQQQQQQQEDYGGDIPDHFVTVIPVGDEVGNYNSNQSAATAAAAATRIMETNTETIKKKEEELKETLSWVRNLLQELDTAEVDPNDEDAEGTELVLPGTVYENVNDDTIVAEEETEDDDDDELVMVHTSRKLQQKITIGNNAIQITDGKNDDDDDDDDEVLNKTEDKRHGNNDNDDPRNHSILNDAGEEMEEDGDANKIQEKTDSPPTNSSFLNNSNNNINNISCTSSSIVSAAFNCTQEDVENCATLPENISGIMPTACQPIINKHTSLYKQTKNENENNKMLDGRHSTNPNDYYLNDRSFDAKFAGEFLHGMLNVGHTLIYHKSIDDENWIGRTVNLIYRPGICSTRTIIQPVIEWKTMTGGTSTVVETRTMKLLNIDAISTSNARGDERQPTLTSGTTSDATTNWCNSTLAPGGMGDLEDEFDSFFTITSQDGEIHLFEALTTEDAQRIVAGIRCNAYRLSNLLIEGNSNALMTDFYDNTGEPTETRLSAPEAMNRLSHAFLDDS